MSWSRIAVDHRRGDYPLPGAQAADVGDDAESNRSGIPPGRSGSAVPGDLRRGLRTVRPDRFVRAVVGAALSAFFGAALVALLYGLNSPLEIDFDRELPRLVGGIYPPERDDASGLTFAWSGREAVLRLRGLDRRARVGPRRACTRRAARHHAEPRPRVLCGWRPPRDPPVGGGLRSSRPPPSRPGPNGVASPSRSALHTPSSPGPSDPRELGVMFDRLTLTPGGRFPPRSALAAVAIATGAIGAALALIGFGLAAAVGGAVAVAAGISVAVSSGFAPYSALPSTAMALSLWAAALTVGTIWALEWRSGASLRNTARFAIAFSACAALLKLLMLLHPNMPVGRYVVPGPPLPDGGRGQPLLHIDCARQLPVPLCPRPLRRGRAVCRDGQPRGRRHDAAADLRRSDRRCGGRFSLPDDRALMGGPSAAAVSVAFYHLIPLGFGVARDRQPHQCLCSIARGCRAGYDLESVAAIGAAGCSSRASRRCSRQSFMSHTSTFAIVFPACLLVIAAFLWKGGPALRSPARAVAIAAGVAVVASIGLYYAHFRRDVSCRVHTAHR